MDLLWKALVVALASSVCAAILRSALKSGGRLFSIKIGKAGPRVASGKVVGAFVEEVRLAAEAHGVRKGRIDGVDGPDRIRLVFSKEIPEGCRQRLRNVWVALGWGDRPKRRGPSDEGGPRVRYR